MEISRHVSRARNTRRLKPSFSTAPRQARAKASWKISLTSPVCSSSPVSWTRPKS